MNLNNLQLSIISANTFLESSTGDLKMLYIYIYSCVVITIAETSYFLYTRQMITFYFLGLLTLLYSQPKSFKCWLEKVDLVRDC